MPSKRDLRDRVASLFELPGEVIADRSRITLVGAGELLIENHRGVHEYNTDRIVLAVPEGKVTIVGEGLTIGAISSEQVTVEGSIRTIEFHD